MFYIDMLVQYLWSFPCLLFIFGVSIYITLQLNFVQFHYFFHSIKVLFHPEKHHDQVAVTGELSPFQAFINTLGGNIGNGSLAGIAVAIHSGGPGAMFWLLLLSTFAVAMRFAEVFLGTYVIGRYTFGSATGGPMVYMSRLPGGAIWSYTYIVFLLGFMFSAGAITQSHAVGSAVLKTTGIDPFYTGFFVFTFVGYVVFGGAGRIVYFLDKLVPLKVFTFLIIAITLLIYHIQAIPHALYLIIERAFHPQAIVGGGLGFGLQQVIAVGFQQGIFANEAGLGTAAVAFGSSKTKSPVESGILSMLSVYINIHVVCFLVGLSIVASGMWSNGETSSALLISSYQTLYGKFAGGIITFLVVNFAMSVLIAGAYNGQKCWDFLSKKNYSFIFPMLYTCIAFYGTWMNVSLVWNINNVVNALLIFINLFGLLWFIKITKQELQLYTQKYRAK